MAISTANTVIAPDFTDTVNQTFFIEPQSGPQDPVTYLDRFPETVYNKAPDSTLVSIMYALLGPAGMGALLQNYLLARLDIEANGLSTFDLDELYANPFSFSRIAQETYENDPTGLLSNAQWEKIREADASYRNRAIDYLKAVRAGGTLQGITLAAKSGLNRPVEVVENYRALYDNFSDRPLGLEFLGLTRSTEEVIVLPRQNRPQSSAQIVTFVGTAVKGTFTISLPMGSETNSTTGELAYNATNNTVQLALETLPIIGPNNVVVTGGPFPAQSMEIAFTGDLADTPIPDLLVLPTPEGGNAMLDINGKLVNVLLEDKQVGVSADGEEAAISPADWHYATIAINNIKPVTTIVTPGKAPGVTQRQIANNIFSGSSFTEVLRYVTGSTAVQWPPLDTTHWIESAKEHEAPVAQFGQQSKYSSFHNIANAVAYTESALEDPEYETSSWASVQFEYTDEHIGPYSIVQKALFPFLAPYTDPSYVFAAALSEANPPEPLTIQSVVNGNDSAVGLIDGIYPTDYQSLPGVPKITTTNSFWSSTERPEGDDYLELDLGTVQTVNYISFEGSSKPYDIDVAYDLLDMAPKRRFQEVTFRNQTEAPSILNLGYNAANQNPWTSVTLNFTTSLGTPIFTRFIRLKFSRRLGGQTPFKNPDGTLIPYSIEVRNLRIGRNIS